MTEQLTAATITAKLNEPGKTPTATIETLNGVMDAVTGINRILTMGKCNTAPLTFDEKVASVKLADSLGGFDLVRHLAALVSQETAQEVDDLIRQFIREHVSESLDLDKVNEFLEGHCLAVLHENNDDEIRDVLDENEVDRLSLLEGNYSRPSWRYDYFYFEECDDFYGVESIMDYLNENLGLGEVDEFINSVIEDEVDDDEHPESILDTNETASLWINALAIIMRKVSIEVSRLEDSAPESETAPEESE